MHDGRIDATWSVDGLPPAIKEGARAAGIDIVGDLEPATVLVSVSALVVQNVSEAMADTDEAVEHLDVVAVCQHLSLSAQGSV